MFVLASNHFQKCFSVNVVFGCAWKINFPEIIFSWPCVLMALTRKLVSVKIFTSNHFRTHAQRERERETPVLKPSSSPTTTAVHSSDQAPIRRPQIELQSDNPHFTGLVDRSTVPIAPRRSSKDLLQRHSISPPPHDLVFASAAWSRL